MTYFPSGHFPDGYFPEGYFPSDEGTPAEPDTLAIVTSEAGKKSVMVAGKRSLLSSGTRSTLRAGQG